MGDQNCSLPPANPFLQDSDMKKVKELRKKCVQLALLSDGENTHPFNHFIMFPVIAEKGEIIVEAGGGNGQLPSQCQSNIS